MAIRVNHPSFLQLPVTHKLMQTHTVIHTHTHMEGFSFSLGHNRKIESARKRYPWWPKWQGEEMEGSERPGEREENDG